ncbi:hypothetical protein Goshw_001867 [Gossypium schwendimanii]|uniref:Uncharacterized protein n=1 Tax=Gossypium schwendimanii TaxID=34291 RepID=A0A7J9MR15_GOSSC|nr:hypothetical protein [Gossypium schwendimanii]
MLPCEFRVHRHWCDSASHRYFQQ